MGRRSATAGILSFALLVALLWLGWSVVRSPPSSHPEEEPDPVAGRPEPALPDAAMVPDSLPGPRNTEQPPLVVITNVPGAEVTLRILVIGGEPDPAPVVKSADGDGIARFTPEAEAFVAVERYGEARAPGYRTATGRMHGRELRLTLERGVAIRGRVVDGRRSAVPWADLVMVGMPMRKAGPDGHFEVFAPEPGRIALAVSGRGHVPKEIAVTAPAEDVLVQLDQGLTIAGRVNFADGSPVPGILVQTDYRQAVTEEDGTYVLAGFGAPQADVEVRCAPSRQRRRARTGDTGVDFLITRSVARIRVVDEQGRPFKRGRIRVRGSRDGTPRFAMTWDLGENGEVVVALPPLTELRVSPSAPGWPEETTVVPLRGEAGLHEIDIVLRRPSPPGAIEVRTVDGEGVPLPFVYATLNGASGALAGFRDVRVALDSDGRGRIEMVPPGHYNVALSSIPSFLHVNGYGLRDVQPMDVSSGATVQVRGRVLEGGRFQVTVRDPGGEVTAPGRIRVLDEAGRALSASCVQAQRDGSWAPWLHARAPAVIGRPLPPGKYTIQILRDGEVAGEGEVRVREGETVELTIDLRH